MATNYNHFRHFIFWNNYIYKSKRGAAARVAASHIWLLSLRAPPPPSKTLPLPSRGVSPRRFQGCHGDRVAEVRVLLAPGFPLATPIPALEASFAGMATVNPFDLLGDDDSEDPSQLIAAQQQKIASKKPAAPASAAAAATAFQPKLPTKPPPPAQAVREAREARNNAGVVRGGGGRGGPGRGRGGRGGGMSQNRDFGNGNIGGASRGYEGAGGGEDGDARLPRQPFSGGRRGGYGGRGVYANGEAGGDSEYPRRRTYDRQSGTGRGYEMKRDGAGRANWGAAADETGGAQLRLDSSEKEEIVNAAEKTVATERQAEQHELPSSEVNKDNKEGVTNEAEEKEEDKVTTSVHDFDH